MIQALHTGSQGMVAQQLNIDTIAHNLSNVNTNGFKKNRVEFQDLLYTTIRRPAQNQDNQAQPLGLQLGLGVRQAAIQTLFSPGNMVATGNPLDVAINGQGFFAIEVPGFEGEELYTRDGAFKLDGEGNIVTSDGYLVLGTDQVPENATDITISQTGLITVTLPDEQEPLEIGQLRVYKFINPAGLDKQGHNLYRRSASSGEPVEWDPEADGSIRIEAGFLETSNVQVVEEMVSMITAQRAYEINSKVIQTSDDMLGIANNLKR
ncbi:MAG: flagellar basal-body rod protein FlgG [Syntrophomonadaceae bacterium]|nr:flagellar basal-body rod protein FlgG [Syntrophomonadaceae bacterium]